MKSCQNTNQTFVETIENGEWCIVDNEGLRRDGKNKGDMSNQSTFVEVMAFWEPTNATALGQLHLKIYLFVIVK